MKNKFFAAILLFASFAFAQYDAEGDNTTTNSEATNETVQEDIQETSSPTTYATEYNSTPKVDETDPYYHAHKGFYFSTSLTFGHTYARHTYTYDNTKEAEYSSESYIYSGFLIPHEEVRLGGSIANTVSIYGFLGVGVGFGSLEYKETYRHTKEYKPTKKYDSARDIRFTLGPGLEFYPIQDKESLFYGMFVGIAAGLSIELVLYKDEGSSSDSYSSNDEFSHSETIGNLFFRGEIGKDWWFSKRWSFGAAINYSFGKFSDDYNNESDVFLNHVIGLTIRITH